MNEKPKGLFENAEIQNHKLNVTFFKIKKLFLTFRAPLIVHTPKVQSSKSLTSIVLPLDVWYIKHLFLATTYINPHLTQHLIIRPHLTITPHLTQHLNITITLHLTINELPCIRNTPTCLNTCHIIHCITYHPSILLRTHIHSTNHII